MSGLRSKRKGAGAEREFAKLTGGRRVPLSGAAAHNGEEFSNDVILPNNWKAEVKRRAEMEKTLYGWLLDEREKPDVVAFRADHKPWVIAMTLDKFMELMGVHMIASSLPKEFKTLVEGTWDDGRSGEAEDDQTQDQD